MFAPQTSTPDSQASKPNTRRAVSDTAATRKPSSSTPPVVSSSSSKPRLWSPTAEPLSPLTPLPPAPHPKTRRNPDYQAVTPWTYRRTAKLVVPFGAPPTLPNFANANLGLNVATPRNPNLTKPMGGQGSGVKKGAAAGAKKGDSAAEGAGVEEGEISLDTPSHQNALPQARRASLGSRASLTLRFSLSKSLRRSVFSSCRQVSSALGAGVAECVYLSLKLRASQRTAMCARMGARMSNFVSSPPPSLSDISSTCSSSFSTLTSPGLSK